MPQERQPDQTYIEDMDDEGETDAVHQHQQKSNGNSLVRFYYHSCLKLRFNVIKAVRVV